MPDNKPLLAKIDDLARIVRLREDELNRAFDRITELELKRKTLQKNCAHHEAYARRLEDALREVRELPDQWGKLQMVNPSLIGENRNHVLEYCATELRKALEVSDE